MDTKEKYLNDKFFICMVAEKEFDEYEYNVPDRENCFARQKRMGGSMPEVDGWLTFFDPELHDNGEAYKHFSFPFRSVEKGGLWFSFPDKDKGKKRPVWKWKNPDEPLSKVTLNPSLGIGSDGETKFHCWVKNGEVEWV